MSILDKIKTNTSKVLNNNMFMSIAIFGSITLAVVSLIIFRELSLAQSIANRGKIFFTNTRWTLHHNDDLMGIITFLTALGLLVYAIIRKTKFFQKRIIKIFINCTLLLLLLSSSLSYLYVTRGVSFQTYVKLHDYYHYHIGPKYFEELGYFDLYDCTVLAEHQGRRVLKDNARIRDLNTYGFISIRRARNRTQCKKNFTPERWEEFVSDINFFSETGGSFLRLILRDHG